MSTYRLERLFAPASVAVVGASPRLGSLGHAVLKNLHEGGFKGAILPVNPKYDEIDGVRCARSIEQLADMPDLVVVCTPPAPVRASSPSPAPTARLARSSSPPASDAGQDRLRRRSARKRASTGSVSSARTASACCFRGSGSTPASRRGARCRGASRSSRSREPSQRGWWSGRRNGASAGRASSRSATSSTSMSPTAWTTSLSTPRPAPSSSTSKRYGTRGSSCPRRGPPRGSSPWSSSSPDGTSRAPALRRPTPARLRARTRSSTPPSVERASCASSTSTSSSPQPRRSAARSRSQEIASRC